jgi:hypothetical protein
MAESDQYARENTAPTALPYGRRRDFFDTLESVSTVSSDERRGRRLRREGIPTSPRFYLDVDLWNPGADDAYRAMRQSFRQFVQAKEGRIVKDPLRIPSLVLVKVVTLRCAQLLVSSELLSFVCAYVTWFDLGFRSENDAERCGICPLSAMQISKTISPHAGWRFIW